MPNRMIKTTNRRRSTQLTSCLVSLFALELLAPSAEMYVFSPWISDMPLLDNRFGQFRSLLPDFGGRQLALSTLFNEFASKGMSIKLLSRDSGGISQHFFRRLDPVIEVRLVNTLHEKGIVTENFYLRGSMNFTFSGININDEHIELTTEATQVSHALLEARERWLSLGL